MLAIHPWIARVLRRAVTVVLRSQMIPVLVRRARALGIAFDSGIDETASEVKITCGAARKLGDRLAVLAKDDLYGFHTALEMPRGAYGVIEYVVRNTPTLDALVVELVRFSRLINAQTFTTFRDGRLEERIAGEPEALGKQGNEFSITHQTRIVRDASRTLVAPERAYFAHAQSGDDRELREYLGVREIVYGCGFNGVDLSKEALATPFVAADPALFKVLEQRAADLVAKLSTSDELENVRRAIAAELATGEPTAKHVASLLGTSERTLHRRIASHASSFGELVDRLRHELALAHLRDASRSVADVAVLLGYSDGRAFARAFRRWTGTTPVAWRASHRSE